MAIGCTRGRKKNQLMCLTCWRKVPKEIQDRVHATYQEKTRIGAEHSAPHSDAIMAAIRAVRRR